MEGGSRPTLAQERGVSVLRQQQKYILKNVCNYFDLIGVQDEFVQDEFVLYYIIDFHMAIIPWNWTLDSIYNSCKMLQVITDLKTK